MSTRPFLSIKPVLTTYINSRIVNDKIMFHLCMLTFITFTWEFSIWEFSLSASDHSNSHESVYYCLLITDWKWECCLIWALNKSISFVSNSLKVSVFSDMNSEKSLYYSLIGEGFSESVRIACCKLWKIM